LLGFAEELLLDRWVPDSFKHARSVEPGGVERRADHIGIVHLFRVFPHVVEYRLDIARQHAVELGGDRASHDLQSVDREERVAMELINIVPSDEPLCLEPLIFRLVFDSF
jgi:hypothetical protein